MAPFQKQSTTWRWCCQLRSAELRRIYGHMCRGWKGRGRVTRHSEVGLFVVNLPGNACGVMLIIASHMLHFRIPA